jgi:hypothetical protein
LAEGGDWGKNLVWHFADLGTSSAGCDGSMVFEASDSPRIFNDDESALRLDAELGH